VLLQINHYDYEDARHEVENMTLLQRCRKRVAEEERPLRQIFDEACRSSDAGTSVSFASVESFHSRIFSRPSWAAASVQHRRSAECPHEVDYRLISATSADKFGVLHARHMLCSICVQKNGNQTGQWSGFRNFVY